MYSVQSGQTSQKTQWKYECECGFNVWHTVAKVELSEEILTELFTTGKTKKKVIGFTSPRREMYSIHVLSLKNDQISFDFDNPGEEEVQSTAEVHNNADANNADAYNNADTQNNADVYNNADAQNNAGSTEHGR